ncbi:MAG: recombinase family protein, partial [Clostridia bacterium]|nr:recombinase family protein [Clostridia bacterium]
VFFQNDNISTLDEDAELRLSIMSSIAQEELRKLSGRVKFGHQQAIKDGVVLGNSRIFGYKKDGGRLVIDEDEAQMIRDLFELYSSDEYSMKQIEGIFWDKGYRNHNGNKLSHSTMANLIANPKYKGYYVGNKVRIVDMFTKKQKFLPPEEWVMFKDETGEIVPAIVSEEQWDKANVILKRRSDDVKSRQGICNHANLMTGKLYCSCCGTAYYRRDSVDKNGEKNSKWVCSGKIKNGADSCESFAIYESEIKPLLFEVFTDTEVSVNALVDEYVQAYRAMDDDNDIEMQIQQQKQRKDMAEKKKIKLLEYNVSGKISDRDFLTMNKQCSEESEDAERQISELEQQLFSKEDFRKHIDNVRNTLSMAQRDASQGMISQEFVNKYIDKIFVTPEEKGVLRLDVRIFTGDSTQKYLSKLKSRTGHTFKKMIKSYEENMK